MLKTLLAKRNISLYTLAKETGVPYTTLSDIKNNKVMVDNISTGTLRRIASGLTMTMDELYEELNKPDSFIKTQTDFPVSQRLYNKMIKLRIPVPEYNVEGQFVLEDEIWSILFKYKDQTHQVPFDGIISNDRFPILKDMGAFQIENHLQELAFQEQAESVITDGKY